MTTTTTPEIRQRTRPDPKQVEARKALRAVLEARDAKNEAAKREREALKYLGTYMAEQELDEVLTQIDGRSYRAGMDPKVKETLDTRKVYQMVGIEQFIEMASVTKAAVTGAVGQAGLFKVLKTEEVAPALSVKEVK